MAPGFPQNAENFSGHIGIVSEEDGPVRGPGLLFRRCRACFLFRLRSGRLFSVVLHFGQVQREVQQRLTAAALKAQIAA